MSRIDVDPGATLTTGLLGLGVQAGPYEWVDAGDDDWATMLARLERLRPGLLRIMLRAWWYTSGYDDRGEPVYDWDGAPMTRLYRLLDWARAHDVVVVTGEWDAPSAVGDRPPGDPLHRYGITATDPRWARLIGDFLHHLLEVRGYHNVRYYTLINEPNGDWSHCGDWPTWERAVRLLAAELDRRGLTGRITIAGPDTTGADEWVGKTAATLGEVVGAYEIHRYVRGELADAAFEAQLTALRAGLDPGAPFFIGEAGVARPGADDTQPARTTFGYGVQLADYAVQALRAGLTGVIAWNLDDAMFTGGGYGALDLKGWGCWNILGGRHGYPAADRDLRPWGYAWAMLATAFRPGSRTLTVADAGIPGLRAVAAAGPPGPDGAERYSVAVVNTLDEPRRVTVTVPGTVPLAEYRYHLRDRPAGADGFPVAAATRTTRPGPLTVRLPSAGLTVLTTVTERT